MRPVEVKVLKAGLDFFCSNATELWMILVLPGRVVDSCMDRLRN